MRDGWQRLRAGGRVYIVPQHKVVFVSVAKNACTTLKWTMAEIAGEDLDSFKAGLKPFPTRWQAVHDRSQWQQARRIRDLSREERAEIHPDNGWFVFAVVRDPRVRLFSAWEQKFLMHHPSYRRLRHEPWYPRFPDSTESITEDFAAFVQMLADHPEHRLLTDDTHFRGQRGLIRSDLVPYSHVYEIAELGRLRADLQAHVAAHGHAGEVVLRRYNDTPLRATAAVFEGGVRERIESVYAADFAEYGDRWDFTKVESVPAWTAADLEQIRTQADYGLRLSELRGIALRQRKRADRLQAEADAARGTTRAGRRG